MEIRGEGIGNYEGEKLKVESEEPTEGCCFESIRLIESVWMNG